MLQFAVLIGLASYRASRLIARDDILAGWRHRFYRRFPPNDWYARHYQLAGKSGRKVWQVGEKADRSLSWWGQLVSCPWCSSVWFAAAITAACTRYVSVPLPVLVWAASCTVSGLCGKIGEQ